MKKYILFASSLFLFASCCTKSPEVPVCSGDEFKTEFILPQRIVRATGNIQNPEQLLAPYPGQVSTNEDNYVSMAPGSSVLLDFGKELHGGIEIVRTISGSHDPARFRLCLGESVSEAMSSVKETGSTATNDHASREMDIFVPWLGSLRVGNSGFRFARLDLLDGEDIEILAVRAVSVMRDIPYLGSFSCSDDRLNEIWQTGAYTVHLCMQDYLWDGIKRDRLVWMGDMHPEVMTANTVFGDQYVIRKSLDYVRDKTAPTDWMNGICSYSLWWIIIQHHLYNWYGDLDYLSQQKEYLTALLHSVMANFKDGKENFTEGRFIDWPSNDYPEVIHAGLQALSVRAMDAGADMAGWLGDEALKDECLKQASALRGYVPSTAGNSQAAALLAISGMLDAGQAGALIVENGPEKFTSFMGYYLLEALAKGGRYDDALRLIREYWGRMIELGATTFWEDFNFEDGKNAARIDEIVPEGKFDIHADGGAYCYVGLRHSFRHGWASGPTAWLSRHVLGIEPVEAGFKKVRIEPNLGELDWAQGTFPTPYGVIEVRHEKKADGSVATSVKLPKGVKRVK